MRFFIKSFPESKNFSLSHDYGANYRSAGMFWYAWITGYGYSRMTNAYNAWAMVSFRRGGSKSI